MNGTQIFLDIFISANFSAGKTLFAEIIVPQKAQWQKLWLIKKKKCPEIRLVHNIGKKIN